MGVRARAWEAGQAHASRAASTRAFPTRLYKYIPRAVVFRRTCQSTKEWNRAKWKPRPSNKEITKRCSGRPRTTGGKRVLTQIAQQVFLLIVQFVFTQHPSPREVQCRDSIKRFSRGFARGAPLQYTARLRARGAKRQPGRHLDRRALTRTSKKQGDAQEEPNTTERTRREPDLNRARARRAQGARSATAQGREYIFFLPYSRTSPPEE